MWTTLYAYVDIYAPNAGCAPYEGCTTSTTYTDLNVVYVAYYRCYVRGNSN